MIVYKQVRFFFFSYKFWLSVEFCHVARSFQRRQEDIFLVQLFPYNIGIIFVVLFSMRIYAGRAGPFFFIFLIFFELPFSRLRLYGLEMSPRFPGDVRPTMPYSSPPDSRNKRKELTVKMPSCFKLPPLWKPIYRRFSLAVTYKNWFWHIIFSRVQLTLGLMETAVLYLN